jgi:hypothetical protein
MSYLSGEVQVKSSVYNEKRLVGHDPSNNLNESTTAGISSDLEDIRGRLYRYAGVQQWDSKEWALNGTNEVPILRFQVPQDSSDAAGSSFELMARRKPLLVQLPTRSVVQRSIGREKWNRGKQRV